MPALEPPQHSGTVRVTHWLTTICFLALLVSGGEILVSHPRFYWGETGNIQMTPLFTLPIPASRASVPTGYGYVLKDQNGWSRSLHFQAAWLLVFTGAAYAIWGLRKSGPRLNPGYGPAQRGTYLAVIVGLFPAMIWTGLAMSPGWTAGFPFMQSWLGGQQSARTIHFFVTLLLISFLAVHLIKVYRVGFWSHTRAMLTGGK